MLAGAFPCRCARRASNNRIAWPAGCGGLVRIDQGNRNHENKIAPGAPRPLALAVHAWLWPAALPWRAPCTKPVSWEDIANDHVTTSNVLQYGMGTNAQRWSPLTQVNESNVFKLTPAWSFSFGDEKQRGQNPRPSFTTA